MATSCMYSTCLRADCSRALQSYPLTQKIYRQPPNAHETEPNSSERHPRKRTRRLGRRGVEEEEDNIPKPPLSFNGVLSKFIFSLPTQKIPITRASTSTFHTSTSKKTPTKKVLQIKHDEPTPTTLPRKRRKHAGYAPPSIYAHLSGIPDALAPNLICIFVGFNPGLASATAGHAFASPTNLFWRLLHSSGCTPDCQLPPSMDEALPPLYSLGHTNLVSRPSRDAAELSKQEMADAVPGLEAKMRMCRPESMCVVGKAVWETMWRGKMGRGIRKNEFKWGWQEMRFAGEKGWGGCRVFVVPSTSGLVAGYSTEFKKALWKNLGDWVQDRRGQRGETVPKTAGV